MVLMKGGENMNKTCSLSNSHLFIDITYLLNVYYIPETEIIIVGYEELAWHSLCSQEFLV